MRLSAASQFPLEKINAICASTDHGNKHGKIEKKYAKFAISFYNEWSDE